MSHEIKRFEKYLNKKAPKLDLAEIPEIILVSDSKGKKLKEVRETLNLWAGKPVTDKISWYNVSGRQGKDGIEFAERELQSWNSKYNSALVVFWHGMCDITKKDGNYIYIRHQDTVQLTDKISHQFEMFSSSFEIYTNLKLLFLEYPPISTKHWNRVNDHPNWEAIDDSIVARHVETYNEIVKTFNTNLGTLSSPRFSLDLQKSRRSVDQGSRYSTNFQMLYDGVHPIPDLSVYWLLRIIEKCVEANN